MTSLYSSTDAPVNGSRPAEAVRTAVVTVVNDKTGLLKEIAETFDKHSVNMTGIQSRPSSSNPHGYDFFIDFDSAGRPDEDLQSLIRELESKSQVVTLMSKGSISASLTGLKTKGTYPPPPPIITSYCTF